ncbi:MAG: porin family protein [Alphaproteobacteria bacterium]|nr:porin family protein [Alphaproteobacteria bacterium]
MKKILLMAGVAAFAFASNANALEVNPYVSAKLSYDWAKNDVIHDSNYVSDKIKFHKNIWGGHYAAGVKARAIRAEVEWNHYQDAKRKDFEADMRFRLQNNTLMLNGYYDINTCTKWTPYVGAGVGVAMLKFTAKDMGDGFKMNEKTYNVAWQVGAGVTYDLTKNVALDAGYRYIDAGAAVAQKVIDDGYEKVKADTAAHEVYFGARYTF